MRGPAAAYFMTDAGEVLSRTRLIEHVWDFAYESGSNIVDVHVRDLREKIDRPFGTRSLFVYGRHTRSRSLPF